MTILAGLPRRQSFVLPGYLHQRPEIVVVDLMRNYTINPDDLTFDE
jgi:hypothetical protein